MIDLSKKRILLTGGGGFLGSHVRDALLKRGVPEENITIPRSINCDLREKNNCASAVEGKDVVIHLAAKAGGIGFNRERPGELFYDNLVMGTHLLEEARKEGVEKFVAMGTICSYPKFSNVPFQEEYIWDGYPEETNAPYGLAKKMMLVQAQAYRQQYDYNAICLMTVNLYGPRDTFDPKRSHVIPALIRKVAEAKSTRRNYIEVWGTGNATREFLYAEDAAEGIVRAAEMYDSSEPINIGSGVERSIKNVVDEITSIMEFEGEVRWIQSEPDGQPRRMLNVAKAKERFGFEAETSFRTGLAKTIEWFYENVGSVLR